MHWCDLGSTAVPPQNPHNPQVHRLTTGPEILADTGGMVDFVVAGVGTGGTLTGVAECIRPKVPGCQFIAVEPSESPVLSGGKPGYHQIQGIGAGFKPRVLREQFIDEVIPIASAEAVQVRLVGAICSATGTREPVLDATRCLLGMSLRILCLNLPLPSRVPPAQRPPGRARDCRRQGNWR